MSQFAGKVTVVTSAGSGIGRALTPRLANLPLTCAFLGRESFWTAGELGNTQVDRRPWVVSDVCNALAVYSDAAKRLVSEHPSSLPNLG
jgi:NAD(P)-dependent dehydrogenase (short-subunit alcohol dehydrogenase family)